MKCDPSLGAAGGIVNSHGHTQNRCVAPGPTQEVAGNQLGGKTGGGIWGMDIHMFTMPVAIVIMSWPIWNMV